MRTVEVFEIGPGFALYRVTHPAEGPDEAVEPRPAYTTEHRFRLGGSGTSGYAWIARLDDKGRVIQSSERQAIIGGGSLGATVMWSGDKDSRDVLFNAMRKANLRPKLALDEEV